MLIGNELLKENGLVRKIRRKYQHIALDKLLLEEIFNHIQGSYKYRTVTDFIRQATIERLEIEKGWEK
ncbi:MAG TPA: hypothetical protein VMY59_01075 [Candidatus Thermoplasmatota archaeon]|nr:hypothetical protein [Candidatus Thermoplasmatota archaeon]